MKEKLKFSESRFERLNQDSTLLELEKWGKYCYLPLDIPRIESTELVDWFNKNKKPIIKLFPDIASHEVRGPNNTSMFDSIDVFPLGNRYPFVWSVNEKPEFLKLFPEIYENIMTGFCLKSVRKIKLWSSNRQVFFHRDGYNFVDYPGSFRVMLYDENPNPTLGLIDNLPDTELNFSKQFVVPRLENTNSFAWNNLRIKHGSNFDNSYNKILIILELCEIDIPKFNNLMERSIEKYKEFAMISNNSITDYVNV
jgi:hypothetical protein